MQQPSGGNGQAAAAFASVLTPALTIPVGSLAQRGRASTAALQLRLQLLGGCSPPTGAMAAFDLCVAPYAAPPPPQQPGAAFKLQQQRQGGSAAALKSGALWARPQQASPPLSVQSSAEAPAGQEPPGPEAAAAHPQRSPFRVAALLRLNGVQPQQLAGTAVASAAAAACGANAADASAVLAAFRVSVMLALALPPEAPSQPLQLSAVELASIPRALARLLGGFSPAQAQAAAFHAGSATQAVAFWVDSLTAPAAAQLVAQLEAAQGHSLVPVSSALFSAGVAPSRLPSLSSVASRAEAAASAALSVGTPSEGIARQLQVALQQAAQDGALADALAAVGVTVSSVGLTAPPTIQRLMPNGVYSDGDVNAAALGTGDGARLGAARLKLAGAAPREGQGLLDTGLLALGAAVLALVCCCCTAAAGAALGSGLRGSGGGGAVAARVVRQCANDWEIRAGPGGPPLSSCVRSSSGGVPTWGRSRGDSTQHEAAEEEEGDERWRAGSAAGRLKAPKNDERREQSSTDAG